MRKLQDSNLYTCYGIAVFKTVKYTNTSFHMGAVLVFCFNLGHIKCLEPLEEPIGIEPVQLVS